jgi:putative phage-type endonuclease
MSEILQGTPEWHQLRLGKVTASRIADVRARTQKGWGAGRENYMSELIVERLTGVPTESFTNAAMQWGTEHEGDARSEYQFFRNTRVSQVAFVSHPSIAETGASPDGLVGDDGLVEIKCPNPATHQKTLDGAPIADKYLQQMMWQMACTGRKWCDFVSFDPRWPESMRLHVRRVPRDDALIAVIERDVTDFLNELRDTVHRLRSKYDPETADDPLVGRELMAG